MGYTTLDAQLLTAPPYVFAAIFSFSLAILSDKTGYRGPFIIFQSIVAIVGLCLTAFHTNNAVRYFGVFLGIGGGSANVASILGYLQNNTSGYSRRGFATAITIGGGGVGGIIASTVFRSKDAPGYRPGCESHSLAMQTNPSTDILLFFSVGGHWRSTPHHFDRLREHLLLLHQEQGRPRGPLGRHTRPCRFLLHILD